MSLLSWTRAKARALIGFASAAALLALAGSGASLAGGAAHAANAPSQVQVDRIAAILDRAAADTAGARQAAGPPALPSPPPPPLGAPASAAPPRPGPGEADVVASAGALDCLAAAVYYEARGEPAEGQAAVAQVVLNRAKRPRFPKTVCGVVYQHAGHGCQFSFACNGAMDRPREWAAWVRAKTVAARALAGYVMADIGEATSFHATHGGAAGVRVGGHVFFAGDGGGSRERTVILAKASPAPARPRYTFSLGVLTEVSATRRPAAVLNPTPVSTAPLEVFDATIPAAPRAVPAAS